jgi:hypothetical protein
VTVALLPVVPRPHDGEALSSWIGRIGVRYDIAADNLLAHVTGWRRSTVGAADRLDYHEDSGLEVALAQAASVAPGAISKLRIAGDDGSASCWHRTAVVWCPDCVRGDLAKRGEVYGRAIWRLGCCVLCPQHQILLEDTCRRCAFEGQCDFCCSDGLLGLACRTCARPVGPVPGRQGEERQHEDLGAFGTCITPSLNRLVWALQSDLQAALAGAKSKRSWGLTRSAQGLMTAILDLTLCLVFATRTRCEPRILLPGWDPGETFAPVREPITLAALPLRAAYGVLAVTAAALSSLEGGKQCHHWRPDGGSTVVMDAASLMAWLPAAIRRWLRSRATQWERPAGEALRSVIAAVEGGA